MANNPSDRKETFIEPIVEPGLLSDWGLMSKIDGLIYLIESGAADVPPGWVLIMDQSSPSIPAGVYKKNSVWSEVTINGDTWREDLYRVTSMSGLMYDEASPSQRFIYNQLNQITSLLETATGMNWGADKFGYMRYVGSSSGQVPSGLSALELSNYLGSYTPREMGRRKESNVSVLPSGS